jgi:hypothetical protein
MATSPDGITYSPFVDGSVQNLTFRFLKLRLEFTSDDVHAVILISNLKVNLNLAEHVETGTTLSHDTDVGGTLVNFVTSFKDIKTLELIVDTQAEFIAAYNFVDAPVPTSFRLFCYDRQTGARVTGTVNWKARGL